MLRNASDYVGVEFLGFGTIAPMQYLQAITANEVAFVVAARREEQAGQ